MQTVPDKPLSAHELKKELRLLEQIRRALVNRYEFWHGRFHNHLPKDYERIIPTTPVAGRITYRRKESRLSRHTYNSHSAERAIQEYIRSAGCRSSE